MPRRFAVLISLLAASAAVAVPGLAGATSHYSLTINATPDPVVTGNPVLVYGQLNGPGAAGQTVVLYHRVNPSHHFSMVTSTTTNSFGFYEFPRAEGVVLTNRSWLVTAPGVPGHVHSRTIDERVAAALTLSSSSPSADTSSPLTFTGSIAPAVVHAGEPVYLQEQTGSSGDDWHTVGRGLVGSGSQFSIPHRFLVPGVYELRAAFRGDNRNIAAQSDPVSVTIQQAENPLFTISTSAPLIDAGQTATVSGVLSSAASSPSTTTSPQAGVWVTLWAHRTGEKAEPVGSQMTGSDGSYSFTVRPVHNVIYQATTTFAPPPRQSSALLFEGVRDVVAITSSSSSATLGQTVTFRGSVSPDRAEHRIYLQERGNDGDYHTVAVAEINDASAYQFVWKLNAAGNQEFRALVPGDRANVSGHSAAVSVSVTLPPPGQLPSS